MEMQCMDVSGEHCLCDVMLYPFHHWGDYQLLVCNSWMLMIWQPPESLLCAITRPHTEAGVATHHYFIHYSTKNTFSKILG